MYVQDERRFPFVTAAFPEWEETMNSWGNKMVATLEAVAELAALGFGLPADAFTSRMHHGPHLLAPTGVLTLRL